MVLCLGLHWSVLQTVAWTAMVISYSRDGSLAEAVNKTLDGKHPCPLCLATEKGRAEEKQQGQKSAKAGGKLDPAVVWLPLALDFRCAPQPMPTLSQAGETRFEAPPKPRPRLTPA